MLVWMGDFVFISGTVFTSGSLYRGNIICSNFDNITFYFAVCDVEEKILLPLVVAPQKLE